MLIKILVVIAGLVSFFTKEFEFAVIAAVIGTVVNCFWLLWRVFT